MGKPSRNKGLRVEREFVQFHEEIGVHAERVPLSGAAGGRFTGDLQIVIPGEPQDRVLLAEVKARKGGQGFVTLEGWLGDNDVLFLKRNNRKPLVVMPWEVYSWMVSRGN